MSSGNSNLRHRTGSVRKGQDRGKQTEARGSRTGEEGPERTPVHTQQGQRARGTRACQGGRDQRGQASEGQNLSKCEERSRRNKTMYEQNKKQSMCEIQL